MSVVINNLNVDMCVVYTCPLWVDTVMFGSRVLIPDRSSDSGIMTVDSDDIDWEYAKINRL